VAPEPSAEVRRSRLRAQWLTPGSGGPSPLEVVRHLIALQAQIPSAAALAVRPRTLGVRAADVARDTAVGGRIVRTWLMRGTLHLTAADDVDWLLALLGPVVLGKSRRRHAQLSLDSATLSRSADLLRDLLEDGPASRAELFAGLAAHGMDPGGQRGIHMIRHAALNGLLVCGPDVGREQTWVLRSAQHPALDRDAALTELARRYFESYAPAGPRDLASWSGLSVADAKHASRLAAPASLLSPLPGASPVRLLPHFDPYLLGYAEHDHAVAPGHRRAVWTGGGYVLPTVIKDGHAVGTWHSEPGGGRLTVTVTPFGSGRANTANADELEAEMADLSRFLDREVRWTWM